MYVNVVFMYIYVVNIKYLPIGLRPNMFKFIELLRTETTLKRLSTFIFKAFDSSSNSMSSKLPQQERFLLIIVIHVFIKRLYFVVL